MGQDRQAQRPAAEAASRAAPPAVEEGTAAHRGDRPVLKPELQVLVPAVRSVLALALALVIAVLILFALAELRGVLVTLLVGIILAEALRPSLRMLEGWGLPRFAALLVVLLALLSVFGLLIALVLPPALVQINQFIAAMPAYLLRLQSPLSDCRDADRSPCRSPRPGLGRGTHSGEPATGAGARPRWSAHLGALGAIFGSLCRRHRNLARRVLAECHPAAWTTPLLHVCNLHSAGGCGGSAGRCASALVAGRRGQFIMMVAIGGASFLVLLVLDVSFPIPLAIWAGLTEFIPLLGPVLGAVPAILVALVDSPTKALLVALAYLLIQQVEGNFLVPKVMERVVGLHPFLVLASVLMGGALLGILGVLLAVPVAAIADALVTELIFEPAGLNEPSGEGESRSDGDEAAPPATSRWRRAMRFLKLGAGSEG